MILVCNALPISVNSLFKFAAGKCQTRNFLTLQAGNAPHKATDMYDLPIQMQAALEPGTESTAYQAQKFVAANGGRWPSLKPKYILRDARQFVAAHGGRWPCLSHKCHALPAPRKNARERLIKPARARCRSIKRDET